MKLICRLVFGFCALCALLVGCGQPGGAPGGAANLPVVATGINTTCVLDATRTLVCYGAVVGTDDQHGDYTKAVTPKGLGHVKAVSLSAYSAIGCAIVGEPSLDPTGPVWCWVGNNPPAPVANLSAATRISVGGPGACAVLAQATQPQTLVCWGIDDGSGVYFSPSLFPRAPQQPATITSGVTDVSVGGHFGCAVQGASNQVVCWGRNDTGQLGRGTVGASSDPELKADMPVVNLSAKKVAAGQTHACAIAGDNSIKCWGQADFGELGNGLNANTFVPAPQTVEGITDAASISAGRAFTCALLSNRTGRCWGQNLPTAPRAGTLGVGLMIADATTAPSIVFRKPGAVSVPVSVKGLTNAVFLSASITHACASGFGAMVRCWGKNDFGQLADGTTDDSLVPVPK